MRKIYSTVLSTVLTIILLLANAFSAVAEQTVGKEKSADLMVEMADTMRSSGKIYVVVGVVLIIFAGFVFYLVSLEKKVGALEKWKQEIEKR